MDNTLQHSITHTQHAGPPQPPDQLLTVDEAAKRLRLKPSTVRAWILGRRIPYAKVGRRVFIRSSDIDRYLEDAIVYPVGESSAERTWVQ